MLVAFHDLREWMGFLEQAGELKHIGAAVDWDQELGAITREASSRPSSAA